MAEELYLEVKTNIGQATKDTKEYKKSLEQVNEEINLQTKFIIAQEKELIKLKAKQDAIPKGGWVAGMDKLNDKIRETTAEINDEKNGLKSLKQEQKEATQEVKKHKDAQKENSKESKESIADLKFMGVSLNGVKKGFAKVIPTAKAMFGTIKAGMISTGIGALVIGVMALIQSFKSSEEGQEKFQRIMAAIGAVTSQVLDLFSDLGETIIDAVTSPMKALESLGNGIVKFFKDPIGATRDIVVKATVAVKTMIEETSKEVDVLIEVTKARQKAHHIDRELKVERAKANREISELRLQSEDREKNSATERIELLRKAQAIEEGITAKEIKSKQILIDAQALEMAQGLATIEDKDKLAQLQAELIDLDTKKLRSQRLLQTQITTAVNEEKAIKEQNKIDKEGELQEKIDTAKTEADILLALQQGNSLALIEDLQERALAELKIQEDKEIASAELLENAEAVKEAIRIKYARLKGDVVKKSGKDEAKWSEMSSKEQLGIASSTAGSMAKILGEESAAGKAFAITQATIDTFQGANAAYSSMAKIPYVGPVLGGIAAAAAIASGIANVKAIASAGGGGGGGGGGATPSVPSGQPAPQMMSGAFDISGGVAPEATKAYVVTDEMSNSQNQLANIRRRATI